MFTWPHYQRDMWLDQLDTFNLSQHCIKLMFIGLVEVEIQRFGAIDFVSGNSLTWFTTRSSLKFRGLVGVCVKRFLFFFTWHHVTTPHQNNTWLCQWKPLHLSCHVVKIDVHRSSGSRAITFLFRQVTSHEHKIKGTCNLVSEIHYDEHKDEAFYHVSIKAVKKWCITNYKVKPVFILREEKMHLAKTRGLLYTKALMATWI